MLRSAMLNRVKKVIERYRLLQRGDRVLVAVSGGPDSVALLAGLHKLAPEMGFDLVAAHLNHGLRAEADAEEEFVRELCLSRGLPLETDRADIMRLSRARGKSIEDTARAVRYSFLDGAAAKHKAARIALGHHLHDQAETVLMNLLRGSGPEGLKGMKPLRDRRYIRPLLYATRREIMDFLTGEGLSFKVDDSNEDPEYLRNRIRHRLLPLLKSDYNPEIETALARTAEITGREDDFMEDQARRILADWRISDSDADVCLETAKLAALHEALARRIVKMLLERFSPDGQGVFHSHVRAVLELAFWGRPSGRLHLPFGIEAKRDYGRLILKRRAGSGGASDYCYPVAGPGKIDVPAAEMMIEFSTLAADHPEVPAAMRKRGGAARAGGAETIKRGQVYLDYDRLTFPLEIRSLRPGDRIRPLGMDGTKKVKAVFIDKKVSRDDRHRIPLLVGAEGVLWIAGLCLDESVRITAGTVRVLKVTYDQVAEKSIEFPKRLL